jgi:hypothetical protein
MHAASACDARHGSLRLDQRLESGLDATGESVEVGHALHFVVGQFDTEVMLETCEEFKRLQAIDLQLTIEFIGRRELLARHFEVLRGENKDFFSGLFECLHSGTGIS